MSARGEFGARTRPSERSHERKSAVTSMQAAVCALVLVLAFIVACSQVIKCASARYVHPTYKFRSVLDGGPSDLEEEPAGRGLSRRQDFDNDNDDDESDADQNAAASYRNQDEGANNGGGGGAESYEDTEPDGPYEETPVEREGQAELERFFDDHLGASDRDGMDKENMPSNLVALLSEPPKARSVGGGGVVQFRVPLMLPSEKQSPEQQAAAASSITAVPMGPVASPQVRPIGNAPSSLVDPLQMIDTIQETSFIRLPTKKMIVTHQVTARHRPSLSALKLNDGARGSAALAAAAAADVGGDENGDVYRGRHRDLHQSRSSLVARTSQATGTTSGAGLSSAARAAPGRARGGAQSDALAARASEMVVATEDDDDDRVYATNATDAPFRIDALGGYDPEEDFNDAAKDLEVMAASDERGRAQSHRNAGPPHGASGSPRGGNQARARTQASAGDDDQYAWAASAPDSRHRALGRQGETLSLQTSGPQEGLLEDASEPDEVTFGQDDPYQTDLEAEMRQQEFDKISGINRLPQAGTEFGAASGAASASPASINLSGNSNSIVDNGEPRGMSTTANTEADDDADAEVDNEYQSEPRVEQTEARNTRARLRPPTSRAIRRDADDEGSWINDGVDDMEIPSQSHQNTVLEKAAQREEAAKRAAEAQAADSPPEEQSGQPSEGDENSQRMPNANYLKNDFRDDDSGYARAA